MDQDIEKTLQLLKAENEKIISDLLQQTPLNFSTWSRLKRQERKQKRIDAALNRLSCGIYGRCLICHQPIAANRLSSLPYIETCLACQYKSPKNMKNNLSEMKNFGTRLIKRRRSSS